MYNVLTLANAVRVSASLQKSPEMICGNSAQVHFCSKAERPKKSTNVKSPPEKYIYAGDRRKKRAMECYRPESVSFLLGKGISSYVILIKGNFIGKNQYSKL